MTALWQEVEPARDQHLAISLINPRRAAINPVPGLDWLGYDRAKRAMFKEFGLETYSDCVSGEMRWRPVPQVVELDERTERLKAVYIKFMPSIWAEVRREAKVPIQTFNRISRLGAPWFNRPESKSIVVTAEYREMLNKPDYFDNLVTTLNVRLQAEPIAKVRVMQFVRPDGTVEEREVGPDMRLSKVKALNKEQYSSRTRLVFGPPCLNLVAQILDTAINNVYGSWPVHHHDLQSPEAVQGLGRVTAAIDVRHMERSTAVLEPIRTAMLSGNYARIHQGIASCPYLAPDTSRRRAFKLRKPARGKIVQFGSGHSAVAPLQKEAVDCVYLDLMIVRWGYSPDFAMQCLKAGRCPRLIFKNFGDDNFWSAPSQQDLQEAFDHFSLFFPCEWEIPSKFLGHEFRNGRFILSETSYLLRTYLHERPPLGRFRKYAYYGWVQKRATYLKAGDGYTMGRLFEFENRVLREQGLDWKEVENRAMAQQRELAGQEPLFNVLLGRDYAMTTEEKLESGMFDGMYEEQTGPIIRELARGGVLDNVF